MPTVSVAVITWNRRQLLQECLESLERGTRRPDELLVFDNGSTDGTLEMLRERFPGAKVTVNPENFGLSYCHNQALRTYSCDALLLLDDDNEVGEDMLEKLMDHLFSRPDLGIVLPLFYNAYDVPPTVCFCGGATSLWTGRNLLCPKEFSPDRRTYPTHRVPNATLIRREAAERTGLMDDRLFSTMADEDFCRRMERQGYRAEFLLEAVTYHKQEVKRSDARRLGLTNPLQTYIFARNRTVLIRRYATPLQFAFYFLTFNWLFHAYYLFNMLRYRAPKGFLTAYLAGIRDSLRHAFGGELPSLAEIRATYEA